MSDLLKKLKKNSTVKDSVVLKDSKLFNKKDMCTTRVPILNVALSGSLDGGLTSGLTVVAGPSKHYKSNLSLLMASAYLEKYEDAVMILYDTEFGITPEYLQSFSIDPERVLHTPVEHVEQLKFDIIRQLENIDRGDHVIVVIDSIGNIASKKELEDTLNEKSVADMTRAKQIKSLFRMCTPYLTTRDIPMIAINHTYESMGLFPTAVMSGGTGIYYSANTIFFMGRQQEKDGKEIAGYNFMLGVEKSRFVKEKTRLPIEIKWEGGINKWSGLLDVAVELGYVIKPSNGWYQGCDPATGEILHDGSKFQKKNTHNSSFWGPIIKSGFDKAIEKRYKIQSSVLLDDDLTDEDSVEEAPEE